LRPVSFAVLAGIGNIYTIGIGIYVTDKM
jgi:hypothetical protein